MRCDPPANLAKENISRIARLETEFLENRSLAGRIADAVAIERGYTLVSRNRKHFAMIAD